MKQTNFIGSENVVNIETTEKIIIFGVYTYVNFGAFLLHPTDKKYRFSSEINKVVNHSSFFSNHMKLCQEKFQ